MEGENGFTLYVAFRRQVSSGSIFFNRLVGFYGAQLEASAISCPRALFRFFTRSFSNSVYTSCHTNCCPKNWFPYSYFRWRKGCYFRFRVLANDLASFFFPHLVRRFVRITISPTRVSLRGTDSLTYILFFLQQAGRSWPTFLIPPFNGHWRPVYSNTEGFGEISYFSPLSGRPRDTRF